MQDFNIPVPETSPQERRTELQQRVRDGTITKDQVKEAVALMRGTRAQAAAISLKARTKKTKKKEVPDEPIDPDSLLSKFQT